MHWWMTLLVTIRKNQKLFLQVVSGPQDLLFQPSICCCLEHPLSCPKNGQWIWHDIALKRLNIQRRYYITTLGFQIPGFPRCFHPICYVYFLYIPHPSKFPHRIPMRCLHNFENLPILPMFFPIFSQIPLYFMFHLGFSVAARFPLPACRSTVAKPLRSVQRRCARSFGGSSVKGMDTASEAEVISYPRDHHGWYTYICRYVDLQLHVNIWIW